MTEGSAPRRWMRPVGDLPAAEPAGQTPFDRARTGELSDLISAAEAVLAVPAVSAAGPYEQHAAFHEILVAIAMTPRTGFARAAVGLSCTTRRLERLDARGADHDLRRECAQILAELQPIEELAVLFVPPPSSQAHADALACLLHEMVLRGVDIDQLPDARRFGASLAATGHALAWMPLTLLPVEQGLCRYLPVHGPTCTSWGGLDLDARAGEPVADAATGDHTIEESTAPEEAERMGRVVADWEEDTGGWCEARTFRIDPAMPGWTPTPLALASLPLECVAGIDASGISARRIPCEAVLEILFGAACNGGAYTHGRRGAYGRLAAWQFLSALCGAEPRAPMGEVLCEALACDWYNLSIQSDWFGRVAWDVAIACVGQRGATLRILAASDED